MWCVDITEHFKIKLSAMSPEKEINLSIKLQWKWRRGARRRDHGSAAE